MNNISSTQNKITNLIFYLSIFLFFLGFNFTDNPPSGWYLQTLPNLNGRSISDMTFTDSLTGYATAYIGTDSNYVLKTTNGGDNWFFIYSDYALLRRIQFLNENTGYICGAYLQKTTNGGLNWTSLNTSGIGVENMYVLNQDTIWIIDSESMTGGVFRTTNGGLNWTQQLSAGSQNPDKIYMYNARIGFITKTNSGTPTIRKTTDGGETWFIASNTGFWELCFLDSLNGWRAAGYIAKTTDGGYTWSQQVLPQGIPGHSVSQSVLGLNANENGIIWAVGSLVSFPNMQIRGILLRTTNYGQSWLYQFPDTSINIFRYQKVKFLNDKIGWCYGAYSGIHTTTGGDTTFYTGVIQTNTEVPKDYILHQNYPNPFNPKTTIEYEIKRSGYITLAVYDIRGKEMTTLVSQKQTPGKYLVDFPGVLFPSGIYFYRLSTDGKPIDTKKMMLIK